MACLSIDPSLFITNSYDSGACVYLKDCKSGLAAKLRFQLGSVRFMHRFGGLVVITPVARIYD